MLGPIDQKISRRTYLKYAGAAVAGAAIGAGAEYLSVQYGWIPSLTQTLTQTITERITETTTVKLASLEGKLFSEYNGDGIQEGEEPAVDKAKVQLKDNTGEIIADAMTDSAGDYKLEDIKTGIYKFCVESDVEANKKYRYMCTSPKEFRAVGDGYNLTLIESGTFDVGLMEGFLTLAFKRGTKNIIYSYFDHDDRIGKVANYLGDTTEAYWPTYHPGTFDQHKGIDWELDLRTGIIASAPGKVIEIAENEQGGKYLDVMHPNGMITSYGHISEAKRHVGDIVSRGDDIALSGDTGSPGQSHLHFALFKNGKEIDPFCDIFGDSEGYWTKKNEPFFPD